MNKKFASIKKEQNSERRGSSFVFVTIGSVIFLTAQLVGLLVARNLYQIDEIRQTIESQQISVVQFLLSFAIGTVIVLLLLKFVKRDKVFQLALQGSLFLGALLFFDGWLPVLGTVLTALAIVLLRQYLPFVMIHNVAVVVAVAGIGSYIGLSFSAWHILVIIAILSVYDVIAVFKTKHMVTMFKKLTKSGATFSIIVPGTMKGLGTWLAKVKLDGKFLFLGTGDIVLPLMLAASAWKIGWQYSIAVIVGAWLGMLAMNIFQFRSKYSKALPALPPIGGGAALGFLVVWVVISYI